MGDMLCSLPLYAALKKKYPAAEITLVAAKTNYPITFFEINPYINRVIVHDKSSLKKILGFILNLKSRKYEIGIVPSTIALSRTSHIINKFSGAKIRIGVKSINGKENESHKLLNVKKDFLWNGVHQKTRNLEIARLAECDLSEEEINSIKFTFNEDQKSLAEKFLLEHFPDRLRKIIAFHPGAGKVQNTWAAENFINLIQLLYLQFNNYVLITSGLTDTYIINYIQEKLTSLSIQFTLLHNHPVKQLGAILCSTNLYITNDTGSMHIAAFSGARILTLFGPTDPNEWAPKGNGQSYIKSYSDNINDITVDEVFATAQKMLGEGIVQESIQL